MRAEVTVCASDAIKALVKCGAIDQPSDIDTSVRDIDVQATIDEDEVIRAMDRGWIPPAPDADPLVDFLDAALSGDMPLAFAMYARSFDAPSLGIERVLRKHLA